jgi:hypothetical protein
MPCAFGVPGSTISGSGCVVEAQRRGREGRRIAPACLSVLVSAATYLAQPFGIGNEFVRDGTIDLPYVWLAFPLGTLSLRMPLCSKSRNTINHNYDKLPKFTGESGRRCRTSPTFMQYFAGRNG